MTFSEENVFTMSLDSSTSTTVNKNYEKLKNKPRINDIELIGNKTGQELGLYSKPAEGINKTDLDTSVQSSLEKADSAIQDLCYSTQEDIESLFINN